MKSNGNVETFLFSHAGAIRTKTRFLSSSLERIFNFNGQFNFPCGPYLDLEPFYVIGTSY
jgi:hypothetical protein